MSDDVEGVTVGQYIYDLEQTVDALSAKNGKLVEALQDVKANLIELRDKTLELVKDNAALERDLYTAAWYGSVHDVGVRFPPESDEAR